MFLSFDLKAVKKAHILKNIVGFFNFKMKGRNRVSRNNEHDIKKS